MTMTRTSSSVRAVGPVALAVVAILLVVQLVVMQVSVLHRFPATFTTSDSAATNGRIGYGRKQPRRPGATKKEGKGGTDPAVAALVKNITAAVCHPTLHGRPDLRKVVHWASYYKALGFDHVFLWHNPNVEGQPHFDELKALPFVTLGVANDTAESYYGQQRVEGECFTVSARNYTWAFAIDADEFLWLAGYRDVKDFLAANDAYKYLSFGKWMYTLRYSDGRRQHQESLFGGVNRLAFTPRSCCRRPPGSPRCPTWKGRSKVMARPAYHETVGGIHGDPSQHADSLHFHTRDAHLKEWPGLLAYPLNRTTARPSASFVVDPDDEDEIRDLNLHWLFRAHKLNANGTVTLHHDPILHAWFEAIAARLPTSDGAAIQSAFVWRWLAMLAVIVGILS
jgi:Glycosyl transferase family 2